MLTLARLLQLVNHTRLPTLVTSPESEEPCVLLPLSVYEQLSKRLPVSEGAVPSRSEVLAPLVEQEDDSTSVLAQETKSPLEVTLEDEEPSGLRLQDLLQVQTMQPSLSSLSAIVPQAGSLEDRFAFEEKEIRILPKVRQKSGPYSYPLDEFGPTLA